MNAQAADTNTTTVLGRGARSIVPRVLADSAVATYQPRRSRSVPLSAQPAPEEDDEDDEDDEESRTNEDETIPETPPDDNRPDHSTGLQEDVPLFSPTASSPATDNESPSGMAGRLRTASQYKDWLDNMPRDKDSLLKVIRQKLRMQEREEETVGYFETHFKNKGKAVAQVDNDTDDNEPLHIHNDTDDDEPRRIDGSATLEDDEDMEGLEITGHIIHTPPLANIVDVDEELGMSKAEVLMACFPEEYPQLCTYNAMKKGLYQLRVFVELLDSVLLEMNIKPGKEMVGFHPDFPGVRICEQDVLEWVEIKPGTLNNQRGVVARLHYCISLFNNAIAARVELSVKDQSDFAVLKAMLTTIDESKPTSDEKLAMKKKVSWLGGVIKDLEPRTA